MVAEMELCWGTVRQAGLAELIEVAGRAGFQAITVNPAMVAAAGFGVAELRARLADAGVRVSNIDALVSVLPGLPNAEEIERTYQSYGTGLDVRRGFTLPEEVFYRTAECAGGDSINLVHFGGDPATPLDAMAEAISGAGRRAAAHGLAIVIEFLPGTAIPDIGTAAQLIEMAAEPNIRMMFDTRHLARSGGSVADVVAHAALVGATQFSDLRWSSADNDNRLLPGDGELPLAEMIAPIRAADPLVPIGIEVFSTELYALPAQEAASRAGEALRGLLRSTAGAQGPQGPTA